MTRNGGVSAAYGFRYQYLRTIESAIDGLDQASRNHFIHTEDPVGDAVDYSICDAEGRYTEIVQVKASSNAKTPLNPGEALAVLVSLIEIDSGQYIFRTNRPLSTGTEDLRIAIAQDAVRLDDNEFQEAVRDALKRTDAVGSFDALDDLARRRLRRCRIEFDPRDASQVYESIRVKVLEYRRQSEHGAGQATSSVLVNHLLAEVFSRSSSENDRRFTLQQFADLLTLDGLVLASAAGGYDWGRHIGVVPPRPTIARENHISDLELLLGAAARGRSARRCVLSGLSGIGKSALCAEFAHRFQARYDFIAWINAETEATIRQSIQRLVVEQDAATLTDEQVQDAVRSRLTDSPGSWLIVMDNATNASSLTNWLPSSGHLDIIATSTERHRWVGWDRIEVLPMLETEAVDLIASRIFGPAGGFDQSELTTMRRLAEKLEYWPLAMELACAHLVASGRRLAVTEEYIHTLTEISLDEPLNVPAEYSTHPTLVAAVKFAFDQLRKSEGKGIVTLPFMTLCAMAYLPARDTPTEVVFSAGLRLHEQITQTSPYPENDATLDRLIRDFGRSSLVTRQVSAKDDITSDTLAANEIVLQIMRGEHNELIAVHSLSCLADLLNEKLLIELERHEYSAIRRLVPSVVNIIPYAKALFASPNLLTLMGNVAKFFSLIEDPLKARQYLEDELALLSRVTDEPSRLHVKIYSALASCAYELSEDVEDVVVPARSAIDSLLAINIDSQSYDSDIKSVSSLSRMLKSINARRSANRELKMEISRLDAFLASAGVREDPTLGSSYRVQDLFQDGLYSEAAELVELTLATEYLSPEHRGLFMSYLIEAYEGLIRPSETLGQVQLTFSFLDQAGLSRRTATTAIINAALATCTRVLIYSPSDGDRRVLEGLTAAVAPEDLDKAEDRYRAEVLRAATDAMFGDLASAGSSLNRLQNIVVLESLQVRSNRPFRSIVMAALRVVQLREENERVPIFLARETHLTGARIYMRGQAVVIPRSFDISLSTDYAEEMRQLAALGSTISGLMKDHADGTSLTLFDSEGIAVGLVWMSGWSGSLGFGDQPDEERFDSQVRQLGEYVKFTRTDFIVTVRCPMSDGVRPVGVRLLVTA